jgi:hypothetical protein
VFQSWNVPLKLLEGSVPGEEDWNEADMKVSCLQEVSKFSFIHSFKKY